MTDPLMPELTKDTYTRQEVMMLIKEAIRDVRATVEDFIEQTPDIKNFAKYAVSSVGDEDNMFIVYEKGDFGTSIWDLATYDEAIKRIHGKLHYMCDQISAAFELEGYAIVNKVHNYRLWVEATEDLS